MSMKIAPRVHLKPGMKINRLTIVEHDHSDKRGRKYFLCRCDCGTEKVIQGSLITSGNTMSCGCYQRELKSKLHRLPNDGGVINHLVLQYKRHAKDRNILYDLDRETFETLVRGNCHYCGVSPSNNKITKACKGFLYNGIDRVDPSRGYYKDNCVPACSKCNRGKQNMNLQEFRDWIMQVSVMVAQWSNL